MDARGRAILAAGGAAAAVLLLGLWLVAGGGDDGPPARAGGGATATASAAPPPVGPRPGTLAGPPPPRPSPTATTTTGAGPTEAAPPATTAGAPPAAALRGRVVDEARRPIEGAEVQAGGVPGEWVTPLLAVTGADGRFALATPPPVPALEVAARGFARRVVPLHGDGGELEVVLLPGRRLAGRVLAAEDRRPLEGALVEGESATWRGRVRAAPDGSFALEDAPRGEELALVATAEGRVARVFAELAAAEVLLERGRRLAGRVVLPDGAPAPGAQVFVVGAGQLARPQRALADAGGAFEVFGLDPQDGVRVSAVHAAGGRPAATPLDGPWLEPGLDEVTAVLAWTRPVEVRGAPADADVALRALDPPPWNPSGQLEGAPSRAGGRTFGDVVPGAYALERDGRRVGPPVVVPPGDGAHVVPWPGAGPDAPPVAAGAPRGALRVRVEDEGRRPVEGATVVVAGVGRDAPRQRATSGPDGLVVVDPAPAGPLVITASAPGRVLVAPAALGAEDAPPEVVLGLVRPVTLEGRVLARPGAGPAELRLSTTDDQLLRTGRTQPDGAFRWPDLAPGEVVLEVSADGCVPASLRLTLPASGPLTITLQTSGEVHDHDHDHEDEGAGGH